MLAPLSPLSAARHVAPRIGRCGIDLVAHRRFCSRPLTLSSSWLYGVSTAENRLLKSPHPASTVLATRRHYQSQAGTEPGLDTNENASDGDGNFPLQDVHIVYQVCIEA